MGGKLVGLGGVTLNETAERILSGIADPEEQRIARQVVLEARETLVERAEAMAGGPLRPETMRRIMNAIGSQYTT